MSLQLSYMEIDSLCRVLHENLLAFASPQLDETRLQDFCASIAGSPKPSYNDGNTHAVAS